MSARNLRGRSVRRNQCVNARRRLGFEALERRIVLAAATDLQSVTGRVFADFAGDGFTPGEEVSGATVNLYRDNGDGIFNAANDTLFRGVTTGSDGRYRIDGVTVGNYFIQQPAQTIGTRLLSERVSPAIVVDAADVRGRLLRTIDSFNTATQSIFDDTNDGVPVTSFAQGSASEVIGGERDLLVDKTSVNGRVQVSVNDPLLPGLFSFDAIQTGEGRRIVSWDGIDGSSAIADAGLGNVDLTSAGTATGLQLQIGADSAAGTVTIRLYTDDTVAGTAARFSAGTFALADTGGVASMTEFIPFSGFTTVNGGGVDLTRVGAIALEITGGSNVNGSAELVGAVGPTVDTFDFANFDSADLRLTKTVSNASAATGQNIVFSVTVNNDGPNAASGVVVTDLLPAGISFVSFAASQGNYNNTTGLWQVGAISNGGSATLGITGRATTAGSVTNTAQVTQSNAFDPDSTPGNSVATEDDQASATINIEAADLSLTNVGDRSAARVGDTVVFTVTVNNAGPSPATGVVVTSVLPPGLTLQSGVTAFGSFAGSTWTIGTIASGASATLTLTTRVDTTGNKALLAQVTASNLADPDSTPNNNVAAEDDQATALVNVTSADLSLTKTASTVTPSVGQNVTFTLQVRNTGPDPASGVNVRDLLPAGLNFVSASPASAYDQATGIWTIGALASNTTSSLQIVATPSVGGSLVNTAEITASDQQDPDSTPNNNQAVEDDQASITINAQQIDLSLTKTVDNATPNRGSTVVFTTTIVNGGPSQATGITVRDALPTGFTFQSATPLAGTAYNSSTGVWSIPTLASGATATLTISAVVNTSAAVIATAQVTAANQSDVDSTPGNNVATEDDQVSVTLMVPAADLSLTKTASTATPNVGQDVTFTIVVSNSGPDNASGVVVSDVLPNGLTFMSATTNEGDYISSTGRWTVGTLASNGTATLQIVARVATGGEKTNTAQIIASDRFDPDSTPNNSIATEDDQASVKVTPQRIDLSLTKTTNKPRPNVGEQVTFTLTLTNAGPDAATQVAVRDVLPAGMTFVSGDASVGTYDPLVGIWTIPTLGRATSATLPLVATYDRPVMILNTAEVVAAVQSDIDSTPDNNAGTEDDQASVTLTPAIADLSLTKTASTVIPNFGQSVAFTLTLVNAGPDRATGVTVRDLLPPELAFVSANTAFGTYNATTGIWDVGSLASAGRATLVINATPTTVGDKTNTAQVLTADQFDPDSSVGNSVATEDDQASVVVTAQRIDLSLEKTINRPAPNVGENVTYSLTLRNLGPSTATGIRIRDVLPSGVTFVSSTSSSGAYVAKTGIWTPTALAADTSATLTIVARVNAAGVATNTAEIIAADQPDVDSTPGNATPGEDDIALVAYATAVADLSLTQTVDNAAPNRNDRVTFTVVLLNSGPDTATNIVVNDRLPIGFNFVDSSTTSGMYVATAGTWNIPTLANGQSATLVLVGTPKNKGPKTNTAEVVRTAQGDPDSTPGNGLAGEDDIAVVTVTPAQIDLSVRSSIDNLAPKVGDIVSVTFSLNNFGPATATGVSLLTVLPTGITLLDNMPSLGTYDPVTQVWAPGVLAAGQNETLTLTFSVDAPGIKQASIQVITADQFDGDSTPANDVITEDDLSSVAINAPRLLTKKLFLAR